jgi:hypothetical protein
MKFTNYVNSRPTLKMTTTVDDSVLSVRAGAILRFLSYETFTGRLRRLGAVLYNTDVIAHCVNSSHQNDPGCTVLDILGPSYAQTTVRINLSKF